MLMGKSYRMVFARAATVAVMLLALSAESATNAAASPETAAGSEVQVLKDQVAELTKALALARSEADGFRARLARYEDRADVVELRPSILRHGLPANLKVLDVNDKLAMIVVPAGAENGIEYGMEFAVMRGEEEVAEVRVIDVRRSIAGLVVVDAKGRLLPQVGDKCIKIRRDGRRSSKAGKR